MQKPSAITVQLAAVLIVGIVCTSCVGSGSAHGSAQLSSLASSVFPVRVTDTAVVDEVGVGVGV